MECQRPEPGLIFPAVLLSAPVPRFFIHRPTVGGRSCACGGSVKLSVKSGQRGAQGGPAVAETTAAAYPDLLAPARRLGGRLAAQLEAERDRWALWIPVGFAAGAMAPHPSFRRLP